MGFVVGGCVAFWVQLPLRVPSGASPNFLPERTRSLKNGRVVNIHVS